MVEKPRIRNVFYIRGSGNLKYISLPTSVKRSNVYTPPCVIALGFFDGLHIAHKALLMKAKKIAEEKQLQFAVMTFFPHPKHVLKQEGAPSSFITPPLEKRAYLKKIGVDLLYLVHFDLNVASLSSQEFVNQYLINHQVNHIVAGFDFRYGNKGEGNIEILKEQGKGFFDVTCVNEIKVNGVKISSTLIRQWILEGQLENLQDSLGRSYTLEGKVISFSYSGASVKVDEMYLIPKSGFYNVEVIINGVSYPALCKVFQDSRELQLHFERSFSYYADNIIIGKVTFIKKLKDNSQVLDSNLDFINEMKVFSCETRSFYK
ncbi:hypothetical protein BTR23_24985 [Alkalihalophilus pseudofirmus]|nr:hypothetical protein BTR23_24985 [Alkalihalophilus pseudofirmus]